MAVTRKEKEETLAQLQDDLKSAKGVVFAQYRGLNVKDMTKLRKLLRNENVKLQVVKLTLLRKAMTALGITGEFVANGPVVLAVSPEEEAAPARILKAASREFPVLALDGGVFDQKVVGKDVVEKLALLPSKIQLLGQLVSVIAGPSRGLVTVLSGNIRGLLNVLSAIKK